MSPTTSRGKSGTVYRYYVSAPLQQGIPIAVDDDQIRRVPAEALERLLGTVMKRFASKAADPVSIVQRVEIHANTLELLLPLELRSVLKRNLREGEEAFADDNRIRMVLPIRLQFRGGRAWANGPIFQVPRPDHKMIKALCAGHKLVDSGDGAFPCPASSPDSPYLRRLIRLAMLAPDIQRALLEGRQPPALTLERLSRSRIPLLWGDQRRVLGFSGEPSPRR